LLQASSEEGFSYMRPLVTPFVDEEVYAITLEPFKSKSNAVKAADKPAAESFTFKPRATSPEAKILGKLADTASSVETRPVLVDLTVTLKDDKFAELETPPGFDPMRLTLTDILERCDG
jgi:hypothetical protein